jgi:hypothetical protein
MAALYISFRIYLIIIKILPFAKILRILNLRPPRIKICAKGISFIILLCYKKL